MNPNPGTHLWLTSTLQLELQVNNEHSLSCDAWNVPLLVRDSVDAADRMCSADWCPSLWQSSWLDDEFGSVCLSCTAYVVHLVVTCSMSIKVIVDSLVDYSLYIFLLLLPHKYQAVSLYASYLMSFLHPPAWIQACVMWWHYHGLFHESPLPAPLFSDMMLLPPA